MVSDLLSVIMPFHNEEATLAEAVSQVLAVELPIPMELILINDGSTDGSAERISRFIADERVVYIRSVARCGKGAAVNRGLSESRGNVLLIQDADLEYRPQDYPRLLAQILENKRELVLGSRVLGAGGWDIRKIEGRPIYSFALNWGAWFLTMMMRLLFGVELTDPATMMKVFRRECLHGIELESSGFDWDWELLCKLLRAGRMPVEIPIWYKGRAPSEGKKLRMWRDGWAALFAIWRCRFAPQRFRVRKSSFAEAGISSESTTYITHPGVRISPITGTPSA